MTELNREERERTITETVASWSLEGMYPSERDKQLIRAYIDGEMTLTEILTATLDEYRVDE